MVLIIIPWRSSENVQKLIHELEIIIKIVILLFFADIQNRRNCRKNRLKVEQITQNTSLEFFF